MNMKRTPSVKAGSFFMVNSNSKMDYLSMQISTKYQTADREGMHITMDCSNQSEQGAYYT